MNKRLKHILIGMIATFTALIVNEVQAQSTNTNSSTKYVGVSLMNFSAIGNARNAGPGAYNFYLWSLSGINYQINRDHLRYKFHLGYQKLGPYRVGGFGSGPDYSWPTTVIHEGNYFSGLVFRAGIHQKFKPKTFQILTGLDFVYRKGKMYNKYSTLGNDRWNYRATQFLISPYLGFKVQMNDRLSLQAGTAAYTGFDLEVGKSFQYHKIVYFLDPVQDVGLYYRLGR